MARKISRGFRSGVTLKFRRIFHDKADQAPIFFLVEGFARVRFVWAVLLLPVVAVSQSAVHGERKKRERSEPRRARVTVFFALSLPAVSSLTSGLKVWAPAFFMRLTQRF